MHTNFTNTKQLENAHTLKQALEESYLNPWCIAGLYIKDDIAGSEKLCDYAVLHPSALILFLDKQLSIAHEQGLTKQKVRRARRDTAFSVHHHFLSAVDKVYDPSTILYRDKDCLVPVTPPPDIPVYSVCLTSVRVVNGNKQLTIRHHYGSNFFAEESVLDFDDVKHTSQLFSLENFVKAAQVLQSIADLIQFFDFHKQALVEGTPFATETELLKAFISSGGVFSQARAIENQLVVKGLRPNVDTSLSLTEEKALTDNFFKMLENGKFWNHIITSFASSLDANLLKDTDSSHRKLLAALCQESVFSRNNMVRLIADFMQAKPELKKTGYMVHARSYVDIERHYVFLFYASDAAHEHHRSQAGDKLTNIASGINHHFQDPPLKEIIVIGIEDNNGQFATDMYYTPGQKVQQSPQHSFASAHAPKSMTAPRVREVSEPNDAKQAYDRMQRFNQNQQVKSGIKRLKVNQGTPKLVSQPEGAVLGRNAPCPCGSGKRFRHCHGASFDYRA